MKNIIIFFALAIIFITSCSWFLGVKKLGNKIYWDDKVIVLTKNDEYDGVGIIMVPPQIKKVAKNENYIIILTLNGANEKKYWLIDKTIESKMLDEVRADSNYWTYYKFSNVFGPLDSADFLNLKMQKKVELDW